MWLQRVAKKIRSVGKWINTNFDRSDTNVPPALRGLLALSFALFGAKFYQGLSPENLGHSFVFLGGALSTIAGFATNTQIQYFIFHDNDDGDAGGVILLTLFSILGVASWALYGLKVAHVYATNGLEFSIYATIGLGIAGFAPILAFLSSEKASQAINKVTRIVSSDTTDTKAKYYAGLWGGYLLLSGAAMISFS